MGKNNRSIRKFKQESVSNEKILAIIEVAIHGNA
jgi:hypothetical protein